MVKPIPDGYQTITPSVMFKDTKKAIEFYKKAFGAVEKGTAMTPDGKYVMHALVQIGTSYVMMADDVFGPESKSAESLGTPSPICFYVYVEDVDKAFKKAIDAGATMVMPVSDMFWGDRFGSVKDPFGYQWSLATHKKDPSQEEIMQGAEAMFSGPTK